MRNRVYYSLKPYLPPAFRLRLRRLHAGWLKSRKEGEWPILEKAGISPVGWPGWPCGKQFAFVLTHDVESQDGLDQVRQLAELEIEEGVRSSFNFVPEGDYAVPAALRAWLLANGFEVGVHDLYHDGWLYRSRAEFQTRAKRINMYLKNWGAVGFRSAFMLHRLDWMEDLEIAYDASTFDTDPFEPQPDGVGTIFPFTIRPRNGRPQFAELPYTLPQDSTMFNVLCESGPCIWCDKLDWISRRGGMALLNVHPDYIDFGSGERRRPKRYPASFYRSFLRYYTAAHSSNAWHPLPRELASFCLDRLSPAS